MKKPRCETNRDVIQHIDPNKKVRVYRNLHRKCISVKQGGIVRCWTTNVVLKDCKFIISKAGQKRVRDEKRKTFMRSLRATWLTFARPTSKRVLHGPKVIIIPISPIPSKKEKQDNQSPVQNSWTFGWMKKILTLCHIKVNKS